MGDRQRLDARRCARSSPVRVRAIRDHDRDPASSRPSATASMNACRLLPRPEMRTAILGSDPMGASARAIWGLTPNCNRPQVDAAHPDNRQANCQAGSYRGKKASGYAGRIRISRVQSRFSKGALMPETYEEYCSLLRVVEEARQKFGMRIIAYNAIDNHFHFLLWPVNDSGPSALHEVDDPKTCAVV